MLFDVFRTPGEKLQRQRGFLGVGWCPKVFARRVGQGEGTFPCGIGRIGSGGSNLDRRTTTATERSRSSSILYLHFEQQEKIQQQHVSWQSTSPIAEQKVKNIRELRTKTKERTSTEHTDQKRQEQKKRSNTQHETLEEINSHPS